MIEKQRENAGQMPTKILNPSTRKPQGQTNRKTGQAEENHLMNQSSSE